jgi:hypothetical protein
MQKPGNTPTGSGFEKARQKVLAFIATVPTPGKHSWEIRDELTREHDGYYEFTWMVRSDFWPKREWFPTVDNHPIVVRNSDGAMFMRSLPLAWDEFVKRMESGDLHPYGFRFGFEQEEKGEKQ